MLVIIRILKKQAHSYGDNHGDSKYGSKYSENQLKFIQLFHYVLLPL